MWKWLYFKYAKEGATVHGVDITETGVDLTKKRFEIFKWRGDYCC